MLARKGNGSKHDDKTTILMMWLGEGNDLEEAALQFTEAIEEKTVEGDESKWLHPGELKRKHGHAEFKSLEDNGTFEESTEAKGITNIRS